jgi:DNA-binding XRE family transcriptional regulator
MFGAWHRGQLHPGCNGFPGYDCVKFKYEDPAPKMNASELCKKARAACNLSQHTFAQKLGVPFRTIQEWEQKSRKHELNMSARTLLLLVISKPEIIDDISEVIKLAGDIQA